MRSSRGEALAADCQAGKEEETAESESDVDGRKRGKARLRAAVRLCGAQRWSIRAKAKVGTSDTSDAKSELVNDSVCSFGGQPGCRLYMCRQAIDRSQTGCLKNNRKERSHALCGSNRSKPPYV